MGTDPKTSVVNRYLQSWGVSNAALAYWTTKAIREQHIKRPGPLVQ